MEGYLIGAMQMADKADFGDKCDKERKVDKNQKKLEIWVKDENQKMQKTPSLGKKGSGNAVQGKGTVQAMAKTSFGFIIAIDHGQALVGTKRKWGTKRSFDAWLVVKSMPSKIFPSERACKLYLRMERKSQDTKNPTPSPIRRDNRGSRLVRGRCKRKI